MHLNTIRKRIDVIDRTIVELIAERQSYMAEMGKYKRAHELPYYQPKREKEILKSKGELASARGVDAVLIKKIFLLIFKNSRRIQKELQ